LTIFCRCAIVGLEKDKSSETPKCHPTQCFSPKIYKEVKEEKMGKADELKAILDELYRPSRELKEALEGLCRMAHRGNRKAIEHLAQIEREMFRPTWQRDMARDCLTGRKT
jgi:hypothetical protein